MKKMSFLLLLLFTLLSVGCAAESVYVTKETDVQYIEVPVEVEVPTESVVEVIKEVPVGTGINYDYSGLDDSVVPTSTTRKIVYTADLTFESFDLDESYGLLTDDLITYGAYIETESVTNTRIYLTIRVPSDQLDTLLDSIKSSGKLLSYSKASEDITNQYSTYEARKLALETQHQRILELIEVAETIEDLMALETQRADIESELNEIGLQLTYYDDLVDYSTVNVQVNYIDFEEYNRLPSAHLPNIYTVERDTDFITLEFRNSSDYTMNLTLHLYLDDEEIESYDLKVFSLMTEELTIDGLKSNTTYKFSVETSQPDHTDPKIITDTFTTYTTYGDDVSNTFERSWESFGWFWVNFSLLLVAAIPVLLTLGVIVTLIVYFAKKRKVKIWGGIKKQKDSIEKE